MLTILGLGPGDPASLPGRNLEALRSGDPVLLRTARHPTLESGPVHDLLASLPAGTLAALDGEYEHGATFEETYAAIVRRVLAAAQSGPVVYAVPGHPLVGESTVALLLEAAKEHGIAVRVLGAPSFIDSCLELLLTSVTGDLHVLDALLLRADDPTAPPELRGGGPILLYQVHSRMVASETKLALMHAGYPDEFFVDVLHAAGIPGLESHHSVPLFRLDHGDIVHDHLTSVFVPGLPPDARKASYFDLVRIMARLRDPEGGCPWDLKQTHATLRRYVIEEAYEVVEAIDSDDPDALADELGDLLLQVVFHAQLAREAGDFDESDVCAAIVGKLIRRHPHIFGSVVAEDADTVLTNWNAIKAREKGESDVPASALDSINRGLPALLLALETSKRAVKVGFEWGDTDAVLAKVDEELAELRAELSAESPDTKRVESELGDLLFTLVNVARWTGIDPEDALRAQVARFGSRFRFMERAALDAGRELPTLAQAEWLTFWRAAKDAEKS
jgi:tetrapyrrole methylase family protein / MazG family protein